jgi:hypothetical protein
MINHRHFFGNSKYSTIQILFLLFINCAMQNSAVNVLTHDQFVSLAEHLLEKIKQNNVDLAEQIVKRLSEIRHGEALDLNDGSDV